MRKIFLICSLMCGFVVASFAQQATEKQKTYTYEEAVALFERDMEFTDKGAEVIEQVPVRTIGEQIAAVRAEKNISLQTLAFVAGLTTEQLEKTEQNRIVPTRDIIVRIEEFLGVDIILTSKKEDK